MEEQPDEVIITIICFTLKEKLVLFPLYIIKENR